MASISDTIVNQAFDTTAGQKGMDSVTQLVGQIQDTQIKRQQLEQQKQSLETTKLDQVIGLIETGISKVPSKAKAAYFKNIVTPRAGQMGINITQEFFDALTSPDVNAGMVGRELVGFRAELKEAVASGDFESAQALGPKILAAFGGNVEAFSKFMNTAVGNETTAAAQTTRLASQEKRFDVKEEAQESRFTRGQEEARVVRVENQAEKLAKRVSTEGIAEFRSGLKGVAEVLPGIFTGKVGNIPGFGSVSGKFPDFMATKQGKVVRQRVKQLRNSVLKAGGGKALTPSEQALFSEVVGITTQLLDVKSEDQLVTGMAIVKDTFNELLKSINSSASPQVRELVAQRGGDLSEFTGTVGPDAKSAIAGGIKALKLHPTMSDGQLARVLKRLKHKDSDIPGLIKQIRGNQ